MRATIFAIDVSYSYRIGREIARRSLARDASPYCLSATKRRRTTLWMAHSDCFLTERGQEDAAFPADARVKRTFSEKKQLPDSSSSSSSPCTKYLSSRVQISDGHVPKCTCSTQISVRTVLPPASLFKAPHGSSAGNAPNFTIELSKFCSLPPEW